ARLSRGCQRPPKPPSDVKSHAEGRFECSRACVPPTTYASRRRRFHPSEKEMSATCACPVSVSSRMLAAPFPRLPIGGRSVAERGVLAVRGSYAPPYLLARALGATYWPPRPPDWRALRGVATDAHCAEPDAIAAGRYSVGAGGRQRHTGG